jgi:hypothetical protein
MIPPVLGRRAAPLDVAALDVKTVAGLTRVLDERLAAVVAFDRTPPAVSIAAPADGA